VNLILVVLCTFLWQKITQIKTKVQNNASYSVRIYPFSCIVLIFLFLKILKNFFLNYLKKNTLFYMKLKKNFVVQNKNSLMCFLFVCLFLFGLSYRSFCIKLIIFFLNRRILNLRKKRSYQINFFFKYF